MFFISVGAELFQNGRGNPNVDVDALRGLSLGHVGEYGVKRGACQVVQSPRRYARLAPMPVKTKPSVTAIPKAPKKPKQIKVKRWSQREVPLADVAATSQALSDERIYFTLHSLGDGRMLFNCCQTLKVDAPLPGALH